MSGVDVIIEDLTTHPRCPHGPTILFSRLVNGEKRNFFACSACRDRKHCPFFLWQEDLPKLTEAKKEAWNKERVKFLKNINHRKLFKVLNEVRSLPVDLRMYCHSCNRFEFDKYLEKHKEHSLLKCISDYQLEHPSEILPALDDAKKEAQFLFAESSVKVVVDILRDLKYSDVICVGTPRIHEYILSNCGDMNSILLDIDDRFHNFFGPLQFCWYNSFNHHFFFDEAKGVFEDFLQNNRGRNMVLITDPPFGGRVEPLAHTLRLINEQYKGLNKLNLDLPIFWAFPYFMEPQILNSLPDFKMLDFKIDYDNHPLFQDGVKGRKYGSPVRFFTNVELSLIKLPDSDYKYCKLCDKWVALENNHCSKCNDCTSKDGRTYEHCDYCKKCVKPTWKHCKKCNRCATLDHKCGEILFMKECFHCKKPGHKKRECPDVNHTELSKKRKLSLKQERKKRNK